MNATDRALVVRERIANRPRHWVRLATACNNRCLFCLDSDTPRNVLLPDEQIRADILRGRVEKDAWKVILSGGEASVHPSFPAMIRYAHEVGYGRVQTVTNGLRYAERDFFEEVMEAGLDEITFSLHGHDADLHDRLVGVPGSFDKLVKGMLRALRDGRPIVNVDIVINRLNVRVLDRIVALCARLGVREFDLLHVIPQASAFDNRDLLFYDVREHLHHLQRVFRLHRRPGFTIWTNRFPVAFLEGMEDLIQDPHKMLDEVNGRRHRVQAYLDAGEPLPCRQPERCVHCFIEPFCTTLDAILDDLARAGGEVWVPREPVAARPPFPYGCRALGLHLPDVAALQALGPPDLPLHLQLDDPRGLAPLPPGSTLVVDTPEAVDHVLDPAFPDGFAIEIHLTRKTAARLLARRARLAALLPRVRLHQPTHATAEEAIARDVRDPAAFFRALDLPVAVSGLPPCLHPGARPALAPRRIEERWFDPARGRLDVDAVAAHHVEAGYRAHSARCDDCPVRERCAGLHINMIRDQGLRLLQPLAGEEARRLVPLVEALHPRPLPRLARGLAPRPVHPSLPGFPPPPPPPRDPLERPARWRRTPCSEGG